MNRRRPEISDAALVSFILWARLNVAEVALNPIIARRVLEAYANEPSGPSEVRAATAKESAT